MSCAESHYAAIVESTREVEVYQRGDVDCRDCLRRMIEKHEQLTAAFKARLASAEGEQ